MAVAKRDTNVPYQPTKPNDVLYELVANFKKDWDSKKTIGCSAAESTAVQVAINTILTS
jgi:hypothetical protein